MMPMRQDALTEHGGGARRVVPELMDDPALPPSQHRAALRGLRRINRISGAGRRIWRALRRELEAAPRPWRILDLACGGGDVSVDVWRRAARSGFEVVVDGVDASGTAIEQAQAVGRRAGAPGRFRVGDALRDDLPAGYDAVMCSLFLHHLSGDEPLALLRRMGEAAGRVVLVDDLVRGAPGLALAWVGTRLLSRSPVVHVDGPRSVRAAFRPGEVERLAKRAGLKRVRIIRHWPQRFLLVAEPGS